MVVRQMGKTIFALIHSPLVGTLTWRLVADQMWQRDINVVIPILGDALTSNQPFWKQHADSVSASLAHIPKDSPVTLVAHSGAGPLLPVIRAAFVNPVNAYVFVDAGVPQDGATRLDLMRIRGPGMGGAVPE